MSIWTNEKKGLWTFVAAAHATVQAIVVGGTLGVFGAASTGCATVPQDRRARLADPMMSMAEDPLETYSKQKLYTSREGAAGGDGAAAGGGCGCQ